MPRPMRYGPLALIVHLLLWMGLTAQAPSPRASPKLIWAFGDSLTAGYGLPPNQGFTAQLQTALRRNVIAAEVRNGGVSGDTAAQGRARLLWGLRGLPRTPDLVIVELGANDMLRGLPPAQARANLERILAELQQRRIPVLLAGMRAAPNMGAGYIRAFEGMYPDLARKYRVPLYPFFMEGVAGNRALIQRDGLHPNARGVQVIVRGILPQVQAALRR